MPESTLKFPDVPFALTARFVVPVESRPIEGGVVTIDDGRIAAVGENLSGRPPIDLGNVAILPGLINAHSHLEFSNLSEPLGKPGMCFPDWIRTVIVRRRETPALENGGTAFERGARESLAAGVTTVADIIRAESLLDATSGPPVDFHATPIGYIACREMIGLAAHRSHALVASAENWLNQVMDASPWRPALSPHASYTVHPDLLRSVTQLSATYRVPVAMHLAESREELELLAAHSGPFLDLLAELDAWEATAIPPGTRPLDYLKILSKAERALVIHGNFLNDVEFEFLAERSNRMSVVYCPRTHAYFAHDEYPLSAMLERGVNVAMGTDSRASNPDLNLLEELRFVARHHQDVSAETVLRLGTINAAAALGLASEIGSIGEGKLADLACVTLPDRRSCDDVFELLFDSTEPPAATIVRGRMVYGS